MLFNKDAGIIGKRAKIDSQSYSCIGE